MWRHDIGFSFISTNCCTWTQITSKIKFSHQTILFIKWKISQYKICMVTLCLMHQVLIYFNVLGLLEFFKTGPFNHMTFHSAIIPAGLVSSPVLMHSWRSYRFSTQWLGRHCQCCALRTRSYNLGPWVYDLRLPVLVFYCHPVLSSDSQSIRHLLDHQARSKYVLLMCIKHTWLLQKLRSNLFLNNYEQLSNV